MKNKGWYIIYIEDHSHKKNIEIIAKKYDIKIFDLYKGYIFVNKYNYSFISELKKIDTRIKYLVNDKNELAILNKDFIIKKFKLKIDNKKEIKKLINKKELINKEIKKYTKILKKLRRKKKRIMDIIKSFRTNFSFKKQTNIWLKSDFIEYKAKIIDIYKDKAIIEIYFENSRKILITCPRRILDKFSFIK